MSQPIDSAAAMRILGLPRTSFWRLIYREKVPHMRPSKRTARFDLDAIEELKKRLTVSSVADLKAWAKRRSA